MQMEMTQVEQGGREGNAEVTVVVFVITVILPAARLVTLTMGNGIKGTPLLRLPLLH